MTLAEKYGIQKGKGIEEINLNENPYKFEGTFKEFYGLVKAGKVKALKEHGQIIGISVDGYETTEADNLAGKAFAEAYDGYTALEYLNLASQLVEANLIPSEITENPVRVTILNGLVTLDKYGNEVKPEPKVEAKAEAEPKPEVEDENDEIRVPLYEVDEDKLKNYIRKTYGRCLARGYQLDYEIDDENGEYVIKNIQWGRKLTEAEKAAIEY